MIRCDRHLPQVALWVACGGLLALFAGMILTIDWYSLSTTEGWALYAITPPPPPTYDPARGLRETLRYALRDGQTDLFHTLEQVGISGRAPLYPLMLNGWAWLTGESVLAIRTLAALLAMLTMAGGVALVWKARRRRSAALTAGVLIVLIAVRGISSPPSPLLWALWVASMLAYRRVLQAKSAVSWAGAVYALLLMLALYTHYSSLWLIVLSGGLSLLSRPSWRWRWVIPTVTALAVFALWPLALWGLWDVPPTRIVANLNLNIALFTSPPDYRGLMEYVGYVRDPFEPMLTDFAPSSPARYYANHGDMLAGLTIDLAWRDPSPDQVRALLVRLNSPRVWVGISQPSSHPPDWLTAFDDGYTLSAQYHTADLTFYRFDRTAR